MPTSIEVQVRHGGQWLPAELATDSSDRAPVVVVAGTNKPLGTEDVFYIRADEDSDLLDAAEQVGFLVLGASRQKMDTCMQASLGALSIFGFWGRKSKIRRLVMVKFSLNRDPEAGSFYKTGSTSRDSTTRAYRPANGSLRDRVRYTLFPLHPTRPTRD